MKVYLMVRNNGYRGFGFNKVYIDNIANRGFKKDRLQYFFFHIKKFDLHFGGDVGLIRSLSTHGGTTQKT